MFSILFWKKSYSILFNLVFRSFFSIIFLRLICLSNPSYFVCVHHHLRVSIIFLNNFNTSVKLVLLLPTSKYFYTAQTSWESFQWILFSNGLKFWKITKKQILSFLVLFCFFNDCSWPYFSSRIQIMIVKLRSVVSYFRVQRSIVGFSDYKQLYALSNPPQCSPVADTRGAMGRSPPPTQRAMFFTLFLCSNIGLKAGCLIFENLPPSLFWVISRSATDVAYRAKMLGFFC